MKHCAFTLLSPRTDQGRSHLDPTGNSSRDCEHPSFFCDLETDLEFSFIPEGTQVYVPPYSLHLDARYFSPSPEKFMPERWIDPLLAPNVHAFIPFSYGPSNCVGRNLARQEIGMVTCLLLSKLEIRFAPGFDAAAWPGQLHDHFVTTKGALMVLVKRR
jgi:hypothetical protein